MPTSYAEIEPHIPIAFCASYIGNEDRFVRLFNMIRSWREQTIPCPLYLSISVPDVTLRKRVEAILTDVITVYKSEKIDFSFQLHMERKSQFENYKSLVEAFRSNPDMSKNPWVVFSDDDDIWHPERIETFTKACYTVDTHHSYIDNIDCQVYAESTKCAIDKAVTSAKDVNRLFETRIATIVDGSNYVTNCVRFERLSFFIDNATKELLSCPFADVRFKAFLSSDGCLIGKQNDSNWMYYYRASDDSITSNKLRVPFYVEITDSLQRKWTALTGTLELDDLNRFKSIINNFVFMICSKVPRENCKRELERLLLCRGVHAKEIALNYRKLYPIVDALMEDDYFKQLEA